ncbi:class I SAM-dependent methyltransferase [Neomoorella thermoacetica]|uniref:class I SAM-dependent methyltransferase n=1 Tax=Neomoorella thermoacetica TaxID=1525 RepID=UPI0008FB4FC2|nr:class I SAM-dependent methyltransferase [Moorella thermoacetica]OIQ59000.1 putative methyltransferase YcgJ [Moorella thermoacetica]
MNKRITNEIWNKFDENRINRAEYFLELILKIVGKSFLVGERFLDIGGGTGTNAAVIGRNFTEKYSLDIKIPPVEKRMPGVIYIQGDAHCLQYDDNFFDVVSLFSVIEHLKNPQVALKEAARVLKQGGLLIIQGPNWRFPLDLHTGLPNPFLIPYFLRKRFLKALNYEWWMDEVFYVSWRNVIQILSGNNLQCRLLGKRSVIYQISLIPNGFQVFYRIIKLLGILSVWPMSYIFIFQKISQADDYPR